MRSTITLLIGLSTLLLFISIHSISYVNAQSGLNNVSDNKSTNANSAVESENLDPFTLRGPSNDGSSVNNNDQATDADDGSSTSSSSDNDDDDNNGSDGEKSSKEDKKSDSKDDKKFELPFP